jgi:hypothetical protein
MVVWIVSVVDSETDLCVMVTGLARFPDFLANGEGNIDENEDEESEVGESSGISSLSG